MAQRKGYNVAAFDVEGDVILTEHYTRKADARKVAREFLAYSNVKSIDIDDAIYNNCGNVIEQYVKIGGRNAIKIIDGVITNVRF